MAEYTTGNKGNPKFAQRVSKGAVKKLPGIVVGTIGILAEQDKERDYNPHILYWSVDRFRKDYYAVAEQVDQKGSFSRYGQSLLDSCFKNWR